MTINEPQLLPFLEQHLKSNQFKIFPLAGDASNRRYYRIVLDQHSWVLMRWEPFEAKNYPFLSVLNHFAKNRVCVPKVEAMSETEGLILLEDLGDLTLERKFWESQTGDSSVYFYEKSLAELIKIHFHSTKDFDSKCTAFNIQFDTDKFLWEMNYGKENLIEGILQHRLSEPAAKEIQKVFFDICETLHKEPKVITHRDYHSRNLMIKFDEVRVIDFQDARLGPIQYDLVSLMRDSYVDMPDTLEKNLLNSYLTMAADHLPKDFSRQHFDHIYELQTIQRCFKACGSFASFFHQRADRRYLKYLPGTLRRVLKTLNHFPQYRAFSDVLIDSGALEQKYESL